MSGELLTKSERAERVVAASEDFCMDAFEKLARLDPDVRAIVGYFVRLIIIGGHFEECH